MSLFHIGELHVKPDQKEALLASLEILKLQAGFISNTVYESNEDKNSFTTVEEWETEQDHKNFMSSLPEDALKQWMDILTQPPKSSYFTKK